VAGNELEPRRSVVSKVVAIVRSFGSGGSLTVTEVAQVASLPLSTTHRLVHELAAWGVLHRCGDARFEIAQRPYRGCCADCRPDLRALAAPTVEDLCAATRNDIRLGLLDGLRVSYVEKTHGSQPLTMFSDAATLPAHATALGKALLAFSPVETVDHVLRHGLRSFTSSTITTAARLRRSLDATRLRGMAVANGELLPGHSAVAVPVFGPGGEAVAALEVRLCDGPAELACVVPALRVAAGALSRELGRGGDQVASGQHPAPPGGWPRVPAVRPTGPTRLPGSPRRCRSSAARPTADGEGVRRDATK
jgi:DNA-binding IclR family transcriptional regulator